MENSSRDQPSSWVTGAGARLGDAVELDQPWVEVDDERRDVQRHALQGCVDAERLEAVAGVAVPEVHLACGEQVVDTSYGVALGEAGEVVVVHQEDVGRVALGRACAEARHRLVVVGVGLQLHLGAGVVEVVARGDLGVGVEHRLGAVDREGDLRRAAGAGRWLRAWGVVARRRSPPASRASDSKATRAVTDDLTRIRSRNLPHRRAPQCAPSTPTESATISGRATPSCTRGLAGVAALR